MSGFSSSINTESIENGFQLAEMIKGLGGKDLSDRHAELLLTEERLAKIQNGNELVWVILALEGKDLSDRHAELLLTPAVLAKIQNGDQLAQV
jgi:hypothetical protein